MNFHVFSFYSDCSENQLSYYFLIMTLYEKKRILLISGISSFYLFYNRTLEY